ncbi:tail assembly chaperone [Haloarcula hispanica tailed virus 2]|uniref:Tail assembly chaperone n=1 Tax=Haloarcula hispanica tailed virus 2 TaxID=1273751 RepID=R4TKL2_9CAUD|nr:tail assembly chaperone [Haloarcula hispanica tailed virus 2]AGM11212.1 hypothetical protein HHTV2_47 [Haloarcula hispanica tailed virus 2]
MTDDTSAQTAEEPANDLPEDVREALPARLRDREDLRIADDPMGATASGDKTWKAPLVDEDTGEVYVLTLTDVSWPKKNDVFTDSLKRTADGGGKLDFAHYYREIAKEMIVSVEPQPENLTVWLQGLKADFGSQLEDDLPAPVSDLEEQQEEN